jgi:hypothetical protein
MNCFHCGRAIATIERVGFRDRCPSCDCPLHACLNCAFHDVAYNNQCRETQAERVVDKDRGNFCDYFTPAKVGAMKSHPAASEAKAKLDSLFRKKS